MESYIRYKGDAAHLITKAQKARGQELTPLDCKYKSLDDAGSHNKGYRKYFTNEFAGVQSLINTFRKTKSEQIEIVATLYACWEKLLKQNVNYSETLLVKQFYAWSEEKEKYEEKRIRKAIV